MSVNANYRLSTGSIDEGKEAPAFGARDGARASPTPRFRIAPPGGQRRAGANPTESCWRSGTVAGKAERSDQQLNGSDGNGESRLASCSGVGERRT